MQLFGIKRHSFVDGPGIRYVIFTQGCLHACPGCHNPESHKMLAGVDRSVDCIVKDIERTKHLDGLTFSGGDPILQLGEVSQIASKVKSLDLNIWLYTGYTFEELSNLVWTPLTRPTPVLDMLADVDVLVDGRFDQSRRDKDTSCLYRGSDNQRLIDLKASIKAGSVVELNLCGGI